MHSQEVSSFAKSFCFTIENILYISEDLTHYTLAKNIYDTKETCSETMKHYQHGRLSVNFTEYAQNIFYQNKSEELFP